MYKIIVLWLLFIFPVFLYAGNIDATNKYARFFDGNDVINFNPSNGNVTVSATSVTGYAWGENGSWINLAPTLGGVSNDGAGILSGYAWGENVGWINFKPTNGGVTIDCNGDFSGYAWSERRGWIVFNCSTDSSCSVLDHKVSTTWDGGTCPVPPPGGGGGGGGPPGGGNPQPACSDNIDNDLDGLVDRFDHACHTDGDPTNTNSYSPLINSENARPVLLLTGASSVSLTVGSSFTDPGATAFDAEDGSLTFKIVKTGIVNTGVVGNYVLTYSVFDSKGLSAIPVVRIVKVISNTPPPPPDDKNTPPVINLVGFPVIVIHQGTSFVEPGFTAFDTEDGDITSFVLISDPVDSNKIGSYIVTYRVTDSEGFSDIVTRIVDVVTKDIPLPPPGDLPPPDDGVPNVPPPEERPGGENVLFPPGPVPDFIAPVVTLVDQPASKFLALLGLILALLSTFTSVLGMTGKFADILLLPARIWSWLLSFFGLRKRNRPWGTVYDSITKQPLDPAYVTLSNQNGEEIATSITDIDGRYGFLVAPGIYTLKAQKTNYVFPSEKLKGKTSDELYPNLYFGEQIELKEKEGIVARNIPMDSVNFDWNEFAKKDHKVMHMYSKFDPILVRISDVFFYVGLVVSIFAFYVLPAPYNTIIFVLYIVMLVLRTLGLRPRFNGRVIDRQTGKPLSFAIVRVKSPELEQFGQSEIAKRVCDAWGRYYLLVPIGTYVITVEQKSADGSYSHVFTSPEFKARKGIINKTFKI